MTVTLNRSGIRGQQAVERAKANEPYYNPTNLSRTLQVSPKALKWFNGLLQHASANGVFSEPLEITPEYAAVLLSRNLDNRSIRVGKAAQIENDLRNGKFVFNGESIIVSKEGLLNDGQHRLYACLRTGVSFKTVLIVGVERASRFTIDTGVAKTAADMLSFKKITNAHTAAAIARFIVVYEAEGSFSRRAFVSATAQIERVENDELLREIAAWIDTSKKRINMMMRGSVAGTLYYLIAEKSAEHAHAFMEQFRSGTNLSATSPIYLLREKLRNDSQLNEMERVEAFVRAWNHWLDGNEKLTRMSIRGNIPAINSPKGPVPSMGSKTDDTVQQSGEGA